MSVGSTLSDSVSTPPRQVNDEDLLIQMLLLGESTKVFEPALAECDGNDNVNRTVRDTVDVSIETVRATEFETVLVADNFRTVCVPLASFREYETFWLRLCETISLCVARDVVVALGVSVRVTSHVLPWYAARQ